MTLLRRVVRTARPAVETLLAGLLVGVVAAVFVSQMIGDASSATVPEVPQARAYMLALLRNDMDTMSQLGPGVDPLGQALNFQQRADALKGIKIDSLTYLGGAALGGGGVHVYVVQAEDATGVHVIPFAITVFQGKVVRVA